MRVNSALVVCGSINKWHHVKVKLFYLCSIQICLFKNYPIFCLYQAIYILYFESLWHEWMWELFIWDRMWSVSGRNMVWRQYSWRTYLSRYVIFAKLLVQCLKKRNRNRALLKSHNSCINIVCFSIWKCSEIIYFINCRCCTMFKLSYLFQCGWVLWVQWGLSCGGWNLCR